ncbi:uridine diphosphate glucose pyrophosphatase NUDT14 isoform X1 [Lepus europaeus]|uniref:uridine diphosphate glucose pyrophosphatase NUDT14 isoform X1 n=1 Tax=Lepus europaeus TaxID=9983 RepID=UPI002B45965C|nr:uridine diphosphate glucose pyrophosphatase NUDT14 isoform X1 [Lepus europaeus]
MEHIEGAAVGPCTASPYLQPLTLHYRQNGTQKSWDFMKTHDSVTLLPFSSSRRSLVLVRQFRPAVYAGEVERHFPGSLAAVGREGPRELQPALPGVAGVTVELCAGLVDQPGLSLEEVACKEAWEECGYRLAPSSLRRVATYRFWRGRCAIPSYDRGHHSCTLFVSVPQAGCPSPAGHCLLREGLPPSPCQLVTRGRALTPQGTLGPSCLPASSAVPSQVPTTEPSLVPQTVPLSVGADQGLAWPGSQHRTHCRLEGALAGPPVEQGVGVCARTQAPLGF